jgi:thiamine kinase-like enzyme
MNTAVEDAIRSFPGWAEAELAIRELEGGMTNHNFVVGVDGQEFVVRIPGERTELLGIDRIHEAEVARRAGELGIGPEVLGELPGVGTQVIRYVAGRHLSGEAFISRLDEVIAAMRTLHESGPVGADFMIHRVVERHAQDALSEDGSVPAAYDRLLLQSQRIETALAKHPTQMVACHNDLLPGNVLFQEDRVWLIDYEYAGNNDPFFDLANLSVNAELDRSGERKLLTGYFGRVTEAGWARFQLMKVMSEFREGMWGVVQQAICSLEIDLVAYAATRLGQAEALTQEPEYEGWLKAAEGDPAV